MSRFVQLALQLSHSASNAPHKQGVRFSIPKGIRQHPWDVFESKLRYMKGYAGESIQLAPGSFPQT